MIYFDTSFLAPLILEEATSGAVEEFLDGLPAGSLAISRWTLVEFASLLAREVRMGGLDAVSAGLADRRFGALAEASFHVFTPDGEDFDRASGYVRRYETALRAGDALHLAVAANRGAEAIYSLDRGMVAAGVRLGLPASVGIEPDD